MDKQNAARTEAQGQNERTRRPWVRPQLTEEAITRGVTAAAATIPDGHITNVHSPSYVAS